MKEKVQKEVLNDKLNVKVESIGRIHRLGKKSGKRPVIVYLQDFTEKKAIQENVKKLKGSGMFIQNDYSRSTLKKRKLLWESAKAERDAKKKVFLVHDRLKIEKDVFVWDESQNRRVQIMTNHSVEPRAESHAVASDESQA